MKTTPSLFKWLTPVAAVGLLFASPAEAAIVVDFSTPGSTAYADNFTQISTGTFFSQQNGYVLGQQGSNWRGSALYGTPTSQFSTGTLSLTASINGSLGTAPGLMLFSHVDSNQSGLVARLLVVSSTNLRLQVHYGMNTSDASGGSLLIDWEYNASVGGAGFYRAADVSSGASGTTGHTLTAGTAYQLVLDANENEEFRFTINTEAGALIATTGYQTSVGLKNALGDQGRIGFGGVASTASGSTLRLYDFTVIPEPSALLLLGGSLMIFGGGRWLRQHRRR